MRSAAILAAALLGSCAVISHDVTDKAVAAHVVGKCFVLMQDAYVVNRAVIGGNDELFSPQNGACLYGTCFRAVKASVPKGTTLTVTKVVNYAQGDNGRCWRTFARLDNTVQIDHDIELPTCLLGGIQRPWVTTADPSETDSVEFERKWLTPCQPDAS